MSTQTPKPKFQTIMSPEADASIDALDPEDATKAMTFLDGILPNIIRRDAISKGSTPLGTVFTFQHGNVIFTCLNGHDANGGRVMVVIGIGAVVL